MERVEYPDRVPSRAEVLRAERQRVRELRQRVRVLRVRVPRARAPARAWEREEPCSREQGLGSWR